jgi:hypothetical protein
MTLDNVAPAIAVQIIVLIVSTIGNILILVAFFKDKKLRKRRNFYIASLASSDLCVGLFKIPSAISVSNESFHKILILIKILQLSQRLPMNDEQSCTLVISFSICFPLVSMFSVIATSFDRYWVKKASIFLKV